LGWPPRRAVVSAERAYRVRRSLSPVPFELRAVDDLVAQRPARLLKDGSRATVAIVVHAGMEIVLKRFREDSILRALEVLFVGSGALRVWHGAALLRSAGFPAPEVLAALERRRFGLPFRSCVLARRVEGRPLDELCRDRTGTARRALVIAFADYLRRLHDAGVYPQDMRGANVVVASESPPVFVLVDLDRVRRYRHVSWRRRRKNLVQVHRSVGRGAPRAEQLRFLTRYLAAEPRAVRRRVAHEVVEHSRVKDAEYQRRRSTGRRWRACVTAEVRPANEGRARLSCFIICCDEERNIGAALESVKWCDEIVIVDSFSRDRTLEICRQYTDRIFQRPWPGFIAQKTFGLEQTRFPWVLNLDADERVSPELRDQIKQVLRDPRADGYYVPRLVYYLGQWWHRGGWYPDYRLRLFRRDRVVWGGVDPHERAILRGRSARLRSPLLHFTYHDIRAHVGTINRFTGVAARELLARGRRARVADLLLRPLWRFVRYYVLRLGFTEGMPGLFVAQSAAFYVFAKYAKLWEAASTPQSREARR